MNIAMYVYDYQSSVVLFFFVFKQKTAYEMRISDWSSDVCSSDLYADGREPLRRDPQHQGVLGGHLSGHHERAEVPRLRVHHHPFVQSHGTAGRTVGAGPHQGHDDLVRRSEEQTSELQSLMRISYAVFCLQKITQADTVLINTNT